VSAGRSARLLFAGELAGRAVTASQLDDPRVDRAVRAGTPVRPLRLLQRAAMKAGLLTYERTVAPRLQAARRSVLGTAADGPPRFLVRVDEFPDYRAADDPRRYGTEAFRRFHSVIAAHEVPYLIAALPTVAADALDPDATGSRGLDDEEARTLASLAASSVTVALHGYDHRTRHRSPRRRSELAGLDARALEARLDAGEAVLQRAGVPRPRVFVAPFNRFEPRQYPILAERYDVICGGPETVPLLGFQPTPVWRGDAVYLPAYPPLYGTAAEVRAAARSLIDARRALWVPVVLHWGGEADRGLADARALAALLSPYAASWHDFLSAVDASR
jgi:Uncharacterized protein conserved in bacteria (DUF2334)